MNVDSKTMIRLSMSRVARRSVAWRLALALGAVALACTPPDEGNGTGGDTTSPIIAGDTGVDTTALAPGAELPVLPPRPLPPLADTIAGRLVFIPTTQHWLLAQVRGKRMLIDIGRVDDQVNKSPDRLAAYRVAVEAYSPVRKGARFRLRGAWGGDDATVTGYDVWNGRIVATIATAPRVDSLARTTDAAVATAERTDSASAPNDAVCQRLPVDSARIDALQDSVERELREKNSPPYPSLQASLKVRKSAAFGCFPGGSTIVAITYYAGDYDWVRERLLLITESGDVRALTVRDYRFRAHELVGALDGDGDGQDELVARGFLPRAGGTAVLRFTSERGLERLASGFAWER